MPTKKKLLIIAGEPSGDLHGSNLARSIMQVSPDIEVSGIGGARMAQAGVKLHYDMSGLAVIGFMEVLKDLKVFRHIFNSLLAKVDNDPPNVCVLIDFPGFNLRFARQLKRRGIPIIYYISPQVWAWGRKRIKAISSLVDKMIVIFDFEKELYETYGLDVEFIGHPLLDVVRPTMTHDEAYAYFNLHNQSPVIGLLPGSRENEIRRHLPIMLKAAQLIKEDFDGVQFLIPRAPTIPKETFHQLIEDSKLPIQVISDKTYDVMNVSDLLLVASGTATLEGAISTRPMVIIYRVNFLSWLLARYLVKIPYIGLVNVVAGKPIVPEFIQYKARPGRIAAEACSLLRNQEKLAHTKRELAAVKEKLGTPGATARCAELILKFLDSR